MKSRDYELDVLVNGKPIKQHFEKNKHLVEAKIGTEYSIRLKNTSPYKLLALFSVDGLDVIKGKAAAESTGGYVVNPYSSVEIKGFRIDDSNVAAFKFGTGSESYASQVLHKGDTEKAKLFPSKNNGVIGVRVWREKNDNPLTKMLLEAQRQIREAEEFLPLPPRIVPPPYRPSPYYPYVHYTVYNETPAPPIGGGIMRSLNNVGASFNSSVSPKSVLNSAGLFEAGNPEDYISSSESVPLSKVEPASFKLGTTWGKQLEDKVVTVSFNREDTFTESAIYYMDRAGLIDFGVDVDNDKKLSGSEFPEPFGKPEYCAIPKGWKKT